MIHSIETRLLDALELFQYAYRFRQSVFVIALEPGVPLINILTDLKVILTSRIAVALVCEGHPQLEPAAATLTKRGLPFSYCRHRAGFPVDEICRQTVLPALSRDSIPVIALLNSSRDFQAASSFYREAARFAEHLQANKLFFVSTDRGLEIDGKFCSHLSVKELAKALDRGASLSLPREQLKFLYEQNQQHKFEIALIEGAPGALFQEIFTHQGRGTLFTDDYPNRIRCGQVKDVFEISRLLKPYIRAGTILPTTEDEIAESISSYFVYTVNSAVVAAAQLVDYGNAAALAKFCTLPRYQGKGRARKLARRMIDAAKEQGKDYAFALSIEPQMWAFFRSLGFSEVARETLPEAWRQNYDFSRPSRAFACQLQLSS